MPLYPRPKIQSERFTTTNSERYAPLIKMKKIEKGQRSAGFCRQRPSDSAAEASRRQQKSEVRRLARGTARCLYIGYNGIIFGVEGLSLRFEHIACCTYTYPRS